MSKEVIWVTEGEFDAIALEYAMMLAGKSKRYPVISLTHGGGSIEKNFKYIEKRLVNHKWIVLVLDDDTVGKKAETWAREFWPDRVVVISKPKGMKDANDAVVSGLAVEMGKLALNFKSNV
jgi:predicted dienelactone hydrolase